MPQCQNCKRTTPADGNCPDCSTEAGASASSGVHVVPPNPQRRAELNRIREGDDRKLEAYAATKKLQGIEYQGGGGVLGGDPKDPRLARINKLSSTDKLAQQRRREESESAAKQKMEEDLNRMKQEQRRKADLLREKERQRDEGLRERSRRHWQSVGEVGTGLQSDSVEAVPSTSTAASATTLPVLTQHGLHGQVEDDDMQMAIALSLSLSQAQAFAATAQGTVSESGSHCSGVPMQESGFESAPLEILSQASRDSRSTRTQNTSPQSVAATNVSSNHTTAYWVVGFCFLLSTADSIGSWAISALMILVSMLILLYQPRLSEEGRAGSGRALSTCGICWEEVEEGIPCENRAGHILCNDCAPREVQRVLTTIREERPLQEHRLRGGRIKCTECSGFYSERALASVLPDEVFQDYHNAQRAVMENQIHQVFVERLERIRSELESNNTDDRTTRNTEESADLIRRQWPNAVQCPKCGAGPVIPEDCFDLEAHHNESLQSGGRISNACPACQFFSRERDDWDKWDGRLR